MKSLNLHKDKPLSDSDITNLLYNIYSAYSYDDLNGETFGSDTQKSFLNESIDYISSLTNDMRTDLFNIVNDMVYEGKLSQYNYLVVVCLLIDKGIHYDINPLLSHPSYDRRNKYNALITNLLLYKPDLINDVADHNLYNVPGYLSTRDEFYFRVSNRIDIKKSVKYIVNMQASHLIYNTKGLDLYINRVLDINKQLISNNKKIKKSNLMKLQSSTMYYALLFDYDYYSNKIQLNKNDVYSFINFILNEFTNYYNVDKNKYNTLKPEYMYHPDFRGVITKLFKQYASGINLYKILKLKLNNYCYKNSQSELLYGIFGDVIIDNFNVDDIKYQINIITDGSSNNNLITRYGYNLFSKIGCDDIRAFDSKSKINSIMYNAPELVKIISDDSKAKIVLRTWRWIIRQNPSFGVEVVKFKKRGDYLDGIFKQFPELKIELIKNI